MKKTSIETIKMWISKNRPSWMSDFFEFLKFPSVSSEIEHKQDLLNCADWLIHYLKDIGFYVETWPTSGHPVIFASYLSEDIEAPTLLLYHHYDVQPADPLEAWTSPPFEPTKRDGEIYARGAQDNKGQCFYTLQALKFIKETHGTFPLSIKLCIEGEEEMGSVGLSNILASKKKELQADYLAVVDTGIKDKNSPAITLGMRGIITFDLHLHASRSDLHSGSHGGIAVNPIHSLIELLGSLRDNKGKVTIAGFYDDVLLLSKEEKEQLSLEFNSEDYQKEIGCPPIGGEHGFSPLEKGWTRPTLEINGINGGYTGSGFKTVIPASAHAKISCRLVPNQDPGVIAALVKHYLEEKIPTGITIEVKKHEGHGSAMRVSSSSAIVKAFSKAFEEVFSKPCAYIYGGGSIPIAAELAKTSGAEPIFVGLGLDSDHIHAPNEHFGIDRIEKGIAIMVKAIEELASDQAK